jgi:hypothetical protein
VSADSAPVGVNIVFELCSPAVLLCQDGQHRTNFSRLSVHSSNQLTLRWLLTI